MTLHNFILFRVHFPDSVITFYIAEWVSNHVLGHVISCVAGKHSMWTSDDFTSLFTT